MTFTLKQVVPWGRSFKEYVKMFNLTKKDLQTKIVSCADGPAGFNSSMKKRGYKVVSCDPIYKLSSRQIESLIDKTYDMVIEQLKHNKRSYVWKTFKTPENVGRVRMKTMRDFLRDYNRGKKEGRYVASRLPKMAFKDNHFDLAICSHFLFLYSEHLSLDFHIKSIMEMLRVAKEVRVFPLLGLHGKKSPYVRNVVTRLKKEGYKISLSKVNYEFQRGGNRMLIVRRFS